MTSHFMNISGEIAAGYEELSFLMQTNAPLAERRLAVVHLKKAGFSLPTEDIGQVISQFQSTLAKPGVILVGSIAFETYCGMRGVINLPSNLVSTKDVDISCPLYVEEPYAAPPLTPQNDYIRAIGDKGVKVDFIVPPTLEQEQKGGVPHWAYAPLLSSYAHTVPGSFRLLLEEPISALVPYGAGIAVTVPHPLRFAMHKLALSCARRESAKSSKDRDQAAVLLNIFCKEMPERSDIAAQFICANNRELEMPLMEGLAPVLPTLSRSAKEWLHQGIKSALTFAPQ